MRSILAANLSCVLTLSLIMFGSYSVNAFQSPFSNNKIRTWKRYSMTTIPQEESSTTTTPTSTSKEPDMTAFASGYMTVFTELPYHLCTPTLGEIPDDIVGSYFRSGPAMFSAGSIKPPKTVIVQPKQDPVPDGQQPERMVQHPYEGDGAILGVTFSPRSNENDEGSSVEVTARFRYVRTPGFTNERKKGMKLYEGMDSTRQLGPSLANDVPLPLFRYHLQSGLNRLRKNTSNTRPVYWAKRLISLWDGGQPFKMDALALSTEGRSRLGGAIPKDEMPFSCKMVYDPIQKRALFHAVETGAKQSEIVTYEFDANFALVEGGRSLTNVPGSALINDFAATKNYGVFVQPDISVNGMKFLLSKEPGSVLTVGNGPALLHLIPRPGSGKASASFPMPVDTVSDANAQFINAYEDGDNVIMDAIRSDSSSLDTSRSLQWPWAESIEQYRAVASRKSLWRYTIDTRRGVVTKTELYEGHSSFGVINSEYSTQRHRYIYMNVGATGAQAAPPQGIACFDCETQQAQSWMPESYEFCGEPMYAPRKGGEASENSGYILSVLYNGKQRKSELVILNASDVSRGPITRLSLGVAVPHGYFGCFTTSEEATWGFEELQRRAKLADKMESRGNMWNEVKSDFSGLGLRFDGKDAACACSFHT